MTPFRVMVNIRRLRRERDQWQAVATTQAEALARVERQVRLIRKHLQLRKQAIRGKR